MGVGTGKDWLVVGKHGWNWEQETAGFGRVCFDVCDDWFKDETWGQEYRDRCNAADLVTCPTSTLQAAIAREAGVQAVVIPEPYEEPERPARCHDKLLWFGFHKNLLDLKPWMPRLDGYELEIVSNLKTPGITEWSPEAMDAAFARAGLVIIPTGVSMSKSNNRAVASIRRGLYPVAGVLPSHADLGVWQGDIAEGVEWALTHRAEVVRRIKSAQRYVAEEYSPRSIGRLWLKALSS